MAKMTHPDMRRGGDVPQSDLRPKTYIVDDLSDDQQNSDIDNKIAEFEGRNTTNVVPSVIQADDKSKKILEDLIFMGQHTVEVEIAGHKFELSTLTHKENNEVVRELMAFGDAADLFTIRVLTLAYSLRKLDGKRLCDINIGGEFDDDFHKCTTIIDNMQLALVERLYDAYENMVKEADSVVYNEKIKN